MRSSLAMKIAGLVCGLLVLVTACQRELGDGAETDNPTPDTCQVSKIIYYDSSGNIDDTAGFTYTSGKITHVTMVSYSMDLLYTGDQVTRINYFDPANTPYDFYDSVGYNSAGKIETLTFMGFVSGSDATPTGGYFISYNADGTPAKVIERTLGPGGVLTDNYEYVYTWNNQNISSMNIRDLVQATNEPPLSFTYDNNENYYKAFPKEFIFADNIMLGISGLQFGYSSPFLFSKNNIMSVNGSPVAYTKDSNGNFNSITIGTHRPASYEYKCN